jgi:uncharacterized protein (TIGR02246 family)
LRLEAFTSRQQEVTMSRAFARPALLLALLASACSDPSKPTALASAEAPDAQYAALAVNPPGQVGHIEALVAAAMAAWTAKDAAAYAATYTEDVHFIGPTAVVVVGREALRLQHVFLFSTVFSQSTQTLEIRRIEFLTGTIAIVELNAALTGYLGLPPGLREAEPGIVRNVVRWVVVKHRGEWLVHGQQMTPVPPLS